MIVTFFGHADFKEASVFEKAFLSALHEHTKCQSVDFYFGGYGAFDDFSYRCCEKFKGSNFKQKSFNFIFVTPYITEDYQKKHLSIIKNKYDEIIYPGIEKTPLRFAISTRNKWMADCSDLIICYVNHSWGGAWSVCKYAASKEKRIINLGNLIF